MPWSTLMPDALAPDGSNSSRGNSTREFGATRMVLLSSNSTSATPFPVFSGAPSVTGKLAMASSRPLPVLRSSWTSPLTSLRRTMRTLELADTGTEGSAVVVAASSPFGAAGATGSCALDDSAKSVKPNRAVVLIAELVFTSASFSIPAGDFSCVLTLRKEGDFPAWLPARQGNATDV